MLSTTLPTAFSLFPLLAPEIRFKIWQYACLDRVVSVRYLPDSDCCLSPSKPPAVLQVCHESRSEALRIYTLSFGTLPKPARIYVNTSQDTLYLPRYRQMGYDETLRDFRDYLKDDQKGVLDEIQRIAIDHVDAAVKRPWESYNKAAFMRDLPKLQEVLLILPDVEERAGLRDVDEFVQPVMEPEELLKIWVEFHQSIAIEEKLLEDISRIEEKPYTKWSLPNVRVMARPKRLAKDV